MFSYKLGQTYNCLTYDKTRMTLFVRRTLEQVVICVLYAFSMCIRLLVFTAQNMCLESEQELKCFFWQHVDNF
jgi:hypothetical protein